MSVRKPKAKPVSSSPFSDFIRNASIAEKERVYTEVMKKAAERQNRVLAQAEALAKRLAQERGAVSGSGSGAG